MEREQIIRMAREAGAMPVVELAGTWITYDEPLQRFAALVAAAEREACAKLCEESNDIGSSYGLAQAIRSRGKT
jgi:sugar phosphate isomerase/epimerase